MTAISVTPDSIDALQGMWAVFSEDGVRQCYGLDFYEDSARGSGFFADLLLWKPGRTGCDSRSSSILRIPLETSPSNGSQLALSGTRHLTSGPPRTVSVEFTLESTGRARGLFAEEGSSMSIILEATETFPPELVA